jgi:hypothetical protein
MCRLGAEKDESLQENLFWREDVTFFRFENFSVIKLKKQFCAHISQNCLYLSLSLDFLFTRKPQNPNLSMYLLHCILYKLSVYLRHMKRL